MIGMPEMSKRDPKSIKLPSSTLGPCLHYNKRLYAHHSQSRLEAVIQLDVIIREKSLKGLKEGLPENWK